ncbi:hypothetical protein FHT97_004546 [Rhizobium sp. BK399]|nr:hypothetical protein [Rhizobium sp. BK181]MBB3543785.1 hypothetical protein [Rhizobium sp. BK399]
MRLGSDSFHNGDGVSYEECVIAASLCQSDDRYSLPMGF